MGEKGPVRHHFTEDEFTRIWLTAQMKLQLNPDLELEKALIDTAFQYMIFRNTLLPGRQVVQWLPKTGSRAAFGRAEEGWELSLHLSAELRRVLDLDGSDEPAPPAGEPGTE